MSYSIEGIASEMPLLDTLDELEHLGVLSAEVAANSVRDAQEGAIMLLECGAQLVDYEAASDNGYIPASVIARLDADSKSFDSIDSRIGESIDARYDEVYELEKEKLLNESSDQSIESDLASAASDSHVSSDSSLRGERGAGAPLGPKYLLDNRKDSIDELIIDLNRLYGEQR